MTLVALTHGYIGDHALGGEVSLHRTLVAAGRPAIVLTRTAEPYTVDGIRVQQIATDDVLNVNADPAPIVEQLRSLGATVVLAQNELSLPAVKAAQRLNIPSIVSVHTPPRYGAGIRQAVMAANHRIYNTGTSMAEWRRPGLVLHPPISPLPKLSNPTGDAYTLLSNLANKGVTVALELAARMPKQRFIIVRSPAEPTHGIPNFVERAAALPNVEVGERVAPEQVAERYLSQTRILMTVSRMETYGLAALEAAGYGIPSVSIMNSHVAEGIGEAAYPVGPLDVEGTARGITAIETAYADYSHLARKRAEWIDARQTMELKAWASFLDTL